MFEVRYYLFGFIHLGDIHGVEKGDEKVGIKKWARPFVKAKIVKEW